MLAANAPIKMDVPIGQSKGTNEYQPRLKHGRKIGFNKKIKILKKENELKRKITPHEDMKIPKDYLT